MSLYVLFILQKTFAGEGGVADTAWPQAFQSCFLFVLRMVSVFLFCFVFFNYFTFIARGSQSPEK